MAKKTSYVVRVVIEKHVREDGVNSRGYQDNAITYQITEAKAEARGPDMTTAVGKVIDRVNLLDEHDFGDERIERAKGL